MKALWLGVAVLVSWSVAGCTRGTPEVSGGGSGEAHHTDEGAQEDVVTLTDAAVKSARLHLAAPEITTLQETISAPASLGLSQTGTARIAARIGGRIARLSVKPGDEVKEGQLLAEVESPELGRLRAEVMASGTRVRVARTNYDRERRLVEKGISSEREMRQAEEAWVAARAEYDAADDKLHALGLSEEEIRQLVKRPGHEVARLPLRSPMAGTVLEVNAVLGESVEPTANLFTVAHLDELWALLQLPERTALDVHKGQEVVFSLQASPKERFLGVVDYVGAVIDPKTRTVQIRVLVANEKGRLKPGMFATGEIPVSREGVPPRPVVPRDAVQVVEGRDVVFVSAGPNRFKPVPVRVGATTSSQAEIVEGLEGDELVVTSGAFILKSELSKESMGEGHSH